MAGSVHRQPGGNQNEEQSVNDDEVRQALQRAADRRDHDEVRRVALEHPAVALVWIDEQRNRAQLHAEAASEDMNRPGITPEERYLRRRAMLRARAYVKLSGVMRQEVQLRLGEVKRAERAAERAGAHRLREAIRAHLLAAMEGDFEPEDHDRRLWATIEDESYEELLARYRADAAAGRPWKKSITEGCNSHND